MRKREILSLGEDFIKKNSIDKNIQYFNEYKTLKECYDRWSEAKESVYHYYYNLLQNNCDCVFKYGIKSYNSMIIILHAAIKKDGKMYYLLITPSYNWYKEINYNE